MHTQLRGDRTDAPVLGVIEPHNLGLQRHRQGHRVILAVTNLAPTVLV